MPDFHALGGKIKANPNSLDYGKDIFHVSSLFSSTLSFSVCFSRCWKALLADCLSLCITALRHTVQRGLERNGQESLAVGEGFRME